MKTYGYIALFLTAFSLIMGITDNPVWLIGGVFSAFFAWNTLSSLFFEKTCTKTTRGKVLSIKANGTYLGGRHQPLHNAEIAYLDKVKTFKNLPPNFIHEVSPGDVIEIKFNPKKPNTAFVNFLN